MGRMKTISTAVCVATLLTAATAAAQGVLPDRKTTVTFSGPVSLPGTTLAAGTYVFKIADSAANRHIVQIFDRDDAKLITTILAVPAERTQPEGDPVISFKETPSDRPPAVRYWYYAGEKAGNEFVYPKAQAMMIARASGEAVSAIDADSSDFDTWKKGNVAKVSSDTATANTSTPATTTPATTSTTPVTTEPAPTPAPTTTPPVPTEPAPTPKPTPGPAPAPTPAPEPSPAPATAPVTSAPSIAASQAKEPVGTSGSAASARLPRTASELPMVGLIGLLALAGGFGVRALRRSIA